MILPYLQQAHDSLFQTLPVSGARTSEIFRVHRSSINFKICLLHFLHVFAMFIHSFYSEFSNTLIMQPVSVSVPINFKSFCQQFSTRFRNVYSQVSTASFKNTSIMQSGFRFSVSICIVLLSDCCDFHSRNFVDVC